MQNELTEGETEITPIHILKQIVDCVEFGKKSEFTSKGELSLVVKKLEEAHLWLQEAIRKEMK